MRDVEIVMGGITSAVMVEGRDVSTGRATGFTLRQHAGQIPALELELIVLDASVIGRAEVEVSVAGVTFREQDVVLLRAGDPVTIHAVADKLASLLRMDGQP